MFNFKDCFDLLTPKQQMEFHYEFKKFKGNDVYEEGFAYRSFVHPKEIISCAFDWSRTSQGLTYWNEIHNELALVMGMFEYSPCNN
jgi:hypothetical protein